MTTRILVTDEVNDEHYTMNCVSGCANPSEGNVTLFSLQDAAIWSRRHATSHGHRVEITDAREVDCRCATLDADLRPCEPCYLRLSPAERAHARYPRMWLTR